MSFVIFFLSTFSYYSIKIVNFQSNIRLDVFFARELNLSQCWSSRGWSLFYVTKNTTVKKLPTAAFYILPMYLYVRVCLYFHLTLGGSKENIPVNTSQTPWLQDKHNQNTLPIVTCGAQTLPWRSKEYVHVPPHCFTGKCPFVLKRCVFKNHTSFRISALHRYTLITTKTSVMTPFHFKVFCC